MALMRKIDFARARGVTPAAVTHAIRSGRIAGAVVTQNGRKLIDFDLASKLWDANTLQQPPPVAARSAPPTTGPARRVSDEDLAAFIRGLPEDQIPELNESRARREHYQAEKARLEALQGRGELVPAADVKRQAFELARAVRDELGGIPDRVASMLAACSDVRQVHRMLSEEIRVALRGLSDG